MFMNTTFEALAYLFLALISTAPFCLIFRKTGHSWALGLLMIVPLVNLVMLVFLALGRWPIEDKLDKARGRLMALGHPLEEATSAFRRAQAPRQEI